MAIAFDAQAGGYSLSSSTVTIPHTIGGGSNRLVTASVVNEFGAVTGVTYNGVAMTLAISEEGGGRISQLYYILEANLPAAGTYDAVVTLTSVGNGTLCSIQSYSGVKQQAPEKTATSGITEGTTVSTNIVPDSDNSLLVDSLYSSEASTTHTTNSSGMNERYDDSISGGGTSAAASDKTITTAGTYSMAWIASQYSDLRHVIASFAPDTGGGGGNTGQGKMTTRPRYWGD